MNYWDNRYNQYGRNTVGHLSLDQLKFEKISQKIKQVIKQEINSFISDRIVLDFGCGYGRNVPVLLESASVVYGVDISQWAIQEAMNYEPRGLYFKYHNDVLPFKDEYIETIFSWTVLQHISNDEIYTIAKELWRVLAPKGYVILYENITPRENKDHIWFRTVSEYSKLFNNQYPLKIKIYVDFDELNNDEIHGLMVYQKT